MSNLKIGPAQTIAGLAPRKGKLHLTCELPGVITLTSSDPACKLSTYSHTVSGTLDSYLTGAHTTGLARRDSTLARSDNFAVAFSVKFSAMQFWSAATSYFCWCHYWGSDDVSGGWVFGWSSNTRKMYVYSWSAATNSFWTSTVFPIDQWVRVVATFSGTTIRIRTSVPSDESFTRGTPNAPAWDGGGGYATYGVTRLQSGLHPLKLKNFQFKRDGLPTDLQVASYLAGTGDISDTLLCKLSLQEESGVIGYDQSGNGKDFAADVPYSGSAYAPPIICGLTRDITGLTNSEVDIDYEVEPGHEGETFTVTATRTKIGFPSSIATETDTVTLTIGTEAATAGSDTDVPATASLTIGPDSTLRKGKILCTTTRPGVVSLASSNPALTLSPSTFTGTGTIDSFLDVAGLSDGLGNISVDLKRITNFTIGIKYRFKTGSAGIESAIALGNMRFSDTRCNWGVMVDAANRRIGYCDPLQNALFTEVFTADTWYRAVLVFGTTSVKIVTLAGEETLARTEPTLSYGSAGDIITRFRGGLAPLQWKHFELYDGVSAPADIAAFIAGTGDLGTTLLVDLPIETIESGEVAYDHSGNAYHFTKLTAYHIPNSPFVHNHTSTNTTSEINYAVNLGHEGETFTITASRTRAGYLVSTETDTCTVSIPASATYSGTFTPPEDLPTLILGPNQYLHYGDPRSGKLVLSAVQPGVITLTAPAAVSLSQYSVAVGGSTTGWMELGAPNAGLCNTDIAFKAVTDTLIVFGFRFNSATTSDGPMAGVSNYRLSDGLPNWAIMFDASTRQLGYCDPNGTQMFTEVQDADEWITRMIHFDGTSVRLLDEDTVPIEVLTRVLPAAVGTPGDIITKISGAPVGLNSLYVSIGGLEIVDFLLDDQESSMIAIDRSGEGHDFAPDPVYGLPFSPIRYETSGLTNNEVVIDYTVAPEWGDTFTVTATRNRVEGAQSDTCTITLEDAPPDPPAATFDSIDDAMRRVSRTRRD